jgi:hypothetical protein
MTKVQVVNELHRSARKNFERRKTIMVGIADTYQIDLIDINQYGKENQNYRYILTVVDIFSKYAWCVPLKSKTGKDVTHAMEKILSAGNVPKNMHSDLGTEFYNIHFKKLMQDYKINHYSTFSTKKAAMCERLIKTLKQKLWKQMHLRGSYKWFDLIESVVQEYNNTKHHTIKMKPKDVKKRHEKQLLNSVYMYNNSMKSLKFNAGQFVRISKYKSVFDKSYTPNWSSEIFKISKVQRTQPVTYMLTDYQDNEIKGAFYTEELQKVKFPDVYLIEKIIKRKGDKLYVKWLGFDSSHNSWVNKNDVEDD